MRNRWLALMLFSSSCLGADIEASDLVELPLEHLMNMDIAVTSTAKREQRSFDAAAAIFVVTADDMRRAGVTTIQDALRMVPGVQVGQIDNNEWAVSIRGLGGRFSRYLQVLIDGRSVYDTLFSGINWDELNLAIEDIDRIEVIRGPGSTVWGANAVNGVVNIVTKTASAKDGNLLAVSAGNYDKARAVVQSSHALGENTEYRVSANYLRRDGLKSTDRNLTEDDAFGKRASLALVHRQGEDKLKVNADIYQLRDENYWINTVPTAIARSGGAAYIDPLAEKKRGYAMQLRYSHTFDPNQTANVRFSYDNISRESNLFKAWDNNNIDLDVEYVANIGSHYLTLGTNNRFNDSDLKQGSQAEFSLTPAKYNIDSNSLFVHDTMSINDYWEVDMGLRYEKQSKLGENVQGTLRAMWMPNDRQRLWAAVSKADSTPSRLTRTEAQASFAVIPSNPLTGGLPVQAVLNSDGKSPLQNTTLVAYEVGYRFAFSDAFTLDATAFYNDYRHTISVSYQSADLRTDPISGNNYVAVVASLGDANETNSSGAEIVLNWQFHRQWFLQYSGSYINFEHESQFGNNPLANLLPSYSMTSDVPAFSQSVRLLGDLSDRWSVSFWLRNVGALHAVGIDEYTVLDSQLSFKPRPDLTVSLVAQNLGDNNHAEAAREAFYVDTFEVKSSVYARVSWAF